MNKILIVDDEERIRVVVKEYGLASGYEVFEATDGYEALDMIAANDYDCVILDLMLPKLDGFSTLKRIKDIKEVPVIILSARSFEDDKLFTFENGSDDYVTKPFSPKELMARIRVVIDRHQRLEVKKEIYEFDSIKIDILGRDVFIDNHKISMTPKEIDLLIYLVKHKNIAISREQLLSSLWDYDYYGDDRTVDTHIKMLRKKLGKYKNYIVTVRGMGYKFEV
ncbi:MAG: response regulator transcription factor [Erysipelotrichaceae bacterium]|nr:response regulator transcription factor [Erysipelotrichaceae bacterium]